MTRRRRIAIAVAVAVALVAVSWPLNILEVRARVPFASVASAFDAPPGYPGYRWSRDGREVGEFELTTIAGPSHCGWQSATMIFIGWPLGTIAPPAPHRACTSAIRRASTKQNSAIGWCGTRRCRLTRNPAATGS